MITFGQVKNSSVASVAGVNVQDPQFAQYVNDAVRQLMDLGYGGARGWWGTVQALTGVAYDGCFVWPANVITVLGIRDCHGVVPIKNEWYSFTNPDERHQDFARRWDGRNTVEFAGQTCLFNSIASSPTAIRALSESSQDNGKAVTIYGLDANGNEVYSLQPDSSTGGQSIQRGYMLVLGSFPLNTTPSAMSYVTDVLKPITISRVRLYASGPGIGRLLAIYNGCDENPKFLYSHTRSRCIQPITALVKLGFTGVAQDADIIPLDNIDAIKSQVQAIRCREGRDPATSVAFEKDALRRLIAQVNSRFPLEQFVVRFKPFGSNDFNRVVRNNI